MFQGLHRSFPPLTDLIAELELELGHPCQANAYLTPPGAQGFAVHADTHDVFVLQTAGTKQWELHADRTGDEEPLLEPGHVDVPAHRHPARGPRAGHGLAAHHHRHQPAHLARAWSSASLSSLAAEVPAEHLPAGYLEDPQALAYQLGRHLSDIADRLRSVDPRRGRRREVRRFLTSRPPRLEAALVDGLSLDAIDDDTLLRRRPGPPVRAASRRATGSRCCSATGPLDVPARIRPALDVVAPPPRAAASATCRSTSRAGWCCARRLVREGLLKVVVE